MDLVRYPKAQFWVPKYQVPTQIHHYSLNMELSSQILEQCLYDFTIRWEEVQKSPGFITMGNLIILGILPLLKLTSLSSYMKSTLFQPVYQIMIKCQEKFVISLGGVWVSIYFKAENIQYT